MPDLGATGALPPDNTPRDLDAELEAEFADHLALVARDEMLRGRAPDVAQEKAKERFGDVPKIERQCRWVHGFAMVSYGKALLRWALEADLR